MTFNFGFLLTAIEKFCDCFWNKAAHSSWSTLEEKMAFKERRVMIPWELLKIKHGTYADNVWSPLQGMNAYEAFLNNLCHYSWVDVKANPGNLGTECSLGVIVFLGLVGWWEAQQFGNYTISAHMYFLITHWLQLNEYFLFLFAFNKNSKGSIYEVRRRTKPKQQILFHLTQCAQ